MTDTKTLISNFAFTLDGAPAPADFNRDIDRVTVENSLHLPDVATIELHDMQLTWADSSQLEPGTKLKIRAGFDKDTALIFDGEIVELEPEYTEGSQRVIIRAFDRLHRLTRGRYVRTFVNVTDGDIIQKIAKEVGLRAKVGPTTQVHEHVMQSGQTNLEFLQERAARLGYLLYVDGEVLNCVEPKVMGGAVKLAWAEELTEFRPRLSTMGQVTEVSVLGWSPKDKREVRGQARDAKFTPKVGIPQSGGTLAKKAFQVDAPYLVADSTVRTQAAAEIQAKAVAEQLGAHFIEAEGVAHGNPKIVAGAQVDISQVGKRFSGTYFVTRSTHSYQPDEGYSTRFSVSGLHPTTLLSALAPDEKEQESLNGLAIGVVTDNKDPDNLGRVKVKYPWLSSEHTSHWARVVALGGGPKRGFMVLPEVNDEVLIGFEMGDFNHPYVIGGLWNGKDAPPIPTSEAVKNGKVEKRVIQTRVGHQIILDDDESKGGITIKDKNGNSIVLTVEGDKLTITTKGDMTFEAKGNLTLKTEKKLLIEAKQKGEIKAMGVTVDGGSSPTEVKGMGVKVEGGGGTVDVKGSMINLN